MKKNSGFTLIELLIVVAIIGILAAIAIPNFLEAQVRAKVARTKADLRSIVLAMETYRVDNNVHLWDGSEVGIIEYLRWSNTSGQNFGIGRLLTSPIAYLASIPFDTFNTKMNRSLTPHAMVHANLKEASVFMRGSNPRAEDWKTGWCAWPTDPPTASQWRAFAYMLSSCGPDLRPWPQDQVGSNWWA